MGRLRRKRMHKNIKDIKKKYRTRRRTKDIDQIHEDMQPKNMGKLQSVDPDLPGSGQHYCIHCARYFINETALKEHFKTKSHKKRLKALKEPIYTQLEAEAAAGMGNYSLSTPPAFVEVKEMEDDDNNSNNSDSDL